MATRRFTKSVIDWAALAERVHPEEKHQFVAFKAKWDKYMRAVLANPEQAPKIDWAHYKQLIPVPGMVEKFQQQYEAFKVPYPTENVTPQIEQEIKDAKLEIERFKKESEKRIAEHNASLEELNAVLPYEQMTLEEFRDSFPDYALDLVKRPTYWPHNEEEQFDHSKDVEDVRKGKYH